MTERLYYDNAYLTAFDAQVLACRANGEHFDVLLDRSAFYPTSGGQPFDTGLLGGARVVDVNVTDGEVWHRLPSVRELAGSLAINPNTIQRSYRQLEMEGWIVTVPGKGCFVCSDERLAEEEKKRLLAAFDAAAEGLLGFGVSTDALIARLERRKSVCLK